MPKGHYKRSKTFTNFKDQKRNNKKEITTDLFELKNVFINETVHVSNGTAWF